MYVSVITLLLFCLKTSDKNGIILPDPWQVALETRYVTKNLSNYYKTNLAQVIIS
jgi:hypothetical protein